MPAEGPLGRQACLGTAVSRLLLAVNTLLHRESSGGELQVKEGLPEVALNEDLNRVREQPQIDPRG